MKQFIQTFAIVLGSVNSLLTIPILFRFHWPSPVLWIVKLFASAISPVLFLLGLLFLFTGLFTSSVLLSLIGLYNVLFFFIHIFKVTQSSASFNNFESFFGFNLEDVINTKQKNHAHFKPTITTLPAVPLPRIEKDISFSTISNNNRKLLCDVWQPNETVASSGLAFIYLHGSAWALLDKDFCTRTFFSQLAAKGHVIMDVAYRLYPETDMMGMVNDAKQAIVWMKENANIYSVNPNTVVIGGGSAGGHLALLAAYTENNFTFTSKELEKKNSSVCGVVSLYGPTDLEAMYYHTNQQFIPPTNSRSLKKMLPSQFSKWVIKKIGKAYYRFNLDKDFANAGVLAILLGGHPNECPEKYALFSPVNHVHKNCPATILIHGQHDLMAPVKSTILLHSRLLEHSVPTVMHVIPQTDHAFDLLFPKISPSAHMAILSVEEFLTLLVNKFSKSV